jgi:phosphohistidine phosphatase
MARTLWLLRHAKTVTDPPPGGTDFDRVLAPRGRRDATALAALFGTDGRGLGHSLGDAPLPELALVSPAARTVATAEMALAELEVRPEQRMVPDLYGAEPEDVVALLQTLSDAVTSVMVVGHNPTAHALSQGLIAKRDKAGHDLATKRGFPTCSLGVYVFAVDRWAVVKTRSATLAGLIIPPFDAP